MWYVVVDVIDRDGRSGGFEGLDATIRRHDGRHLSMDVDVEYPTLTGGRAGTETETGLRVLKVMLTFCSFCF